MDLIWTKDDGGGGDMQSSSEIVTTNKPAPNFLQARCTSCDPTNSVGAVKEDRNVLWNYYYY